MSCWTLWQRMPPRYQLTMRDARCDDPDSATASGSRSSSATPSSARLRTPRGARRADSARARLSESGTMLTSGVRPEDYPARCTQPGPQSPVLPPRSSPYVHNMKTQLRLHTAKRKMDEDGGYPGLGSSTLCYTPKPRATTAPAFPITDPGNTDRYHRASSPAPPRRAIAADPDYSPYERQRPRRGFSGRRSPRRPSSGYSRDAAARRVAVSTIAPFGEARDFRAEGHSPFPPFPPSAPRLQDCVIGECQVAAVYVDKGRVTFFRKTRPDVTQSVYSAISPYNVTRDDGSYLSHLRKAYLSGVRDLPKVSRKEPDMDKHTTIRERMDYDRKVGRILEYYAKVDIPKDVHAPRPPESQYTVHPSLPPSGQQGFKTFASRKRAPVRAPEVRGSLVPVYNGAEVPSPRDLHPSLALPARDSAGGFVRINARARLHARHNFYLRTPASPGLEGSHQDDSCACGMCRLEMEVALMAQLHRDLAVSVDAITASQIRADLEQASVGGMQQGGQQQAGPAPEDSCPARPNSVSDSQRPTHATEPSQPSSPASQAPATPTQTLAPEATSLTVTLPIIEEAAEGQAAVADSQDPLTESEERGPREGHPAQQQVAANASQEDDESKQDINGDSSPGQVTEQQQWEGALEDQQAQQDQGARLSDSQPASPSEPTQPDSVPLQLSCEYGQWTPEEAPSGSTATAPATVLTPGPPASEAQSGDGREEKNVPESKTDSRPEEISNPDTAGAGIREVSASVERPGTGEKQGQNVSSPEALPQESSVPDKSAQDAESERG